MRWLMHYGRVWRKCSIISIIPSASKIVISGFWTFSYDLLDRSCWAELKYDRILAVWGRGFELWLLKVQKNRISSIFGRISWQVWYSDESIGLAHTVFLILYCNFSYTIMFYSWWKAVIRVSDVCGGGGFPTLNSQPKCWDFVTENETSMKHKYYVTWNRHYEGKPNHSP